MNIYRNINPCIGDDFNRAFNARLYVPKVGLAIGAGLTGWATLINSTIPTRLAFFAIPCFIDYLRISNDIRVEERSLEFLNWIVGYRRASAFNEKHRSLFQTE